ncbi:tetratricopeptide repeat protein [Cohnella thailandensis]|uniref:Tetratricopeptide repeat protein n=1 Tax=Cohnella thailandensis TaxID=557557 RepID=A0A841T669_9BACL|nr:tetratricopeptide repeat protein [Cohnella thailandensis]MBB6637560.1 tetratricopeptide repeat protein [Cohnella thailandensis]MBP1974264.1 tetratricopeptide (TPR) repeat protein [Cohnella thailandensis]
MNPRKHAVKNRRKKVIPFSLDATFFFERAVQSLDRFHYDKALKYFRRAVEYEPNNPVNHCNMAGILSEMGRYEESNDILRTVLERVDPSMTECYYYLANNFANMEKYEEAEKALVQYLETDAEGQFLDEADELLELLRYELNRPTKLSTIKSKENVYAHDKARELLEAGHFAEAVRILEEIIERQPDFLAARNNLGLAYYYMGLFDKSIQTIQEVLDAEPGNLHALCNLAIFYQHSNKQEELRELLGLLMKTVPFHPEHVFKLSTTLGIVGKHAEAYRHFRRLLRTGELSGEPSLHHFAAVAAANIGRFDDAERHWQEAQRLDRDSDVPAFYLMKLAKMRTMEESPPLHYHYHLPFDEQFRKWADSPEMVPGALKQDPLIRSSFFWALRHGDRRTKAQVIQALGLVADDEVVEALKAFLIDPKEDDELKRVAVLVLRSIGLNESLYVMFGGRMVTLEAKRKAPRLPVWDSSWQAVLEKAMEQMAGRYDVVQQHDMMTLWVDYLSRVYPDVPKLSKSSGWAAALEYWTAKMHRQAITYTDLVARYEASQASISRYVNRIDEACGIREKMKQVLTIPQLPQLR